MDMVMLKIKKGIISFDFTVYGISDRVHAASYLTGFKGTNALSQQVLNHTQKGEGETFQTIILQFQLFIAKTCLQPSWS